MAIPNRYVLGAKPRIRVTPRDTNGIIFVPSEIRLSVKEPTGTIITYSGGDMTTASGGDLFVLYKPPVVGWYQTEAWVKDANSLEDTATDGFEVYDLVYAD